jgi:hypothetical protein
VLCSIKRLDKGALRPNYTIFEIALGVSLVPAEKDCTGKIKASVYNMGFIDTL